MPDSERKEGVREAGLASVMLALVPLFTLVFASLVGLESLRMRGVVGALAALGGVAIMFRERAAVDVPLAHLLASVATAACFALAPVVVKRFPAVHVATNNAVGMFTGAVILLVLSAVTGEPATIPQEPTTWAAQLYLAIPGSVGVFGLLLFVLGRWPASTVSYQAVLSPIVAIALSAWLLDEPVTGGLFLGGALVLMGVIVGALAPQHHAR